MTDDLFGDDPEFQKAAEHYTECYRELIALLEDFADDYDLDADQTIGLLLDAAISFRTITYYQSVEHPSASGMKLDLDRLRREFDEIVRGMKKEVDQRIALYREMADSPDEEPEAPKG